MVSLGSCCMHGAYLNREASSGALSQSTGKKLFVGTFLFSVEAYFCSTPKACWLQTIPVMLIPLSLLTKPENPMPQMSLFINNAAKLGPRMAQLGDLFQNGINSKPTLTCSPEGPWCSGQWGGLLAGLLSLSLFLMTSPVKLTALFRMFNRWDWEQSFLLMLCYQSV